MHQRYQAMSESLSTHEFLSVDDIVWGARTFAHFDLTKEVAAKHILLANLKLATGRYAIVYNLTLENIIKERDEKRLKKLLRLSFDQLYPEFSNNIRLTPIQREVILRHINREFKITLLSLENPAVDHYMPYVKDKLPADVRKGSLINYEKAFSLICIDEDPVNAGSPYLTETIRVASGGHCYPRGELIKRLARDDYTDPATGQPFSPGVINVLLNRFDSEIKMLKFHTGTAGSVSGLSSGSITIPVRPFDCQSCSPSNQTLPILSSRTPPPSPVSVKTVNSSRVIPIVSIPEEVPVNSASSYSIPAIPSPSQPNLSPASIPVMPPTPRNSPISIQSTESIPSIPAPLPAVPTPRNSPIPIQSMSPIPSIPAVPTPRNSPIPIQSTQSIPSISAPLPAVPTPRNSPIPIQSTSPIPTPLPAVPTPQNSPVPIQSMPVIPSIPAPMAVQSVLSPPPMPIPPISSVPTVPVSVIPTIPSIPSIPSVPSIQAMSEPLGSPVRAMSEKRVYSVPIPSMEPNPSMNMVTPRNPFLVGSGQIPTIGGSTSLPTINM